MPIYVYECPECYAIEETLLPLSQRDTFRPCHCGAAMERKVTSGAFRMPGGNSKINYADAFTADVMGYSYDKLPDALKSGRK